MIRGGGLTACDQYPPVLSFGAGVNSTALAILLVNEGWRGHIVLSETGTEWPDTYCFMTMFEDTWLKPRGLSITRLGAEWRGKPFSMSLIERCEQKHAIPLATLRWCTAEYKSKPIERWCKAQNLDNQIDAMIGIAADESHRAMSRTRPLVDRGIDRDRCIKIIRAEGLDVPRKSGCYICPFQRVSQWKELWERHPELYARAERLENVPRKKPGRTPNITLDISGKTTLAMRRLAFESQMELFDDEEYLEYRPCQCHL